MRRFSLALLLGGLAASVAALDPIEAVGNKFFRKDGSQFYLKGISYQLRPNDPLLDAEQCQRDVKLMQELGANSIRVYHVNAKGDHDGCMKAFADAGIYLLIDLDTFETYITPSNNMWSKSQYDNFTDVLDAFHSYDNVLAFFVGNENVYKKEESYGAPFLKAAARDIKAYRDSKGYRKIPIGYSAADIKELRPMLQDYLTCGGNSSEIIDFYGINSYSWCDPSDYQGSTYDQLEEYAVDFPVPIFFTETGCNVPGPRTWEDQDAIFGKNMVNDWSGSIIYEWIQEQNNYGIVSYGEAVGDPSQNDESVFDNWSRKGTPTPRNPDFNNLKSRWANIKPTGVSKADYDPSKVSTRPCPTSTKGGWWEVDGDVALPQIGQTVTAFGPGAKLDGGSDATITSAPTSTASEDEASSTSTSTNGGATSAVHMMPPLGAMLAIMLSLVFVV